MNLSFIGIIFIGFLVGGLTGSIVTVFLVACAALAKEKSKDGKSFESEEEQ